MLASGPQTIVVDAGRRGYQRYGVPPTGAFDRLALACANVLVGNPPDTAALEFVLAGPRLRFAGDVVACLAGGPFRAALAGPRGGTSPPLEPGRPFVIPAGAELEIGPALAGLRGILAVSGGIGVPPVLGSRSTDLRGRFGGLEGRPLAAGDTLPLGTARWANLAAMERWVVRVAECADALQDMLPEDAWRIRGVPGASGGDQRPGEDRPPTLLRAVPGPQAERFTAEAQRTLFECTYHVRPDSDRMGIRLDGPRLEHAAPPDIPSDATVPGAIQVPADGRPIILGVDAQTTGGYPKPATVIGLDLGRMAQARPGHRVAFAAVTPAQAVALARRRAAALEAFRRDVEAWGNPPPGGRRLLVELTGVRYRVTIAPQDATPKGATARAGPRGGATLRLEG